MVLKPDSDILLSLYQPMNFYLDNEAKKRKIQIQQQIDYSRESVGL